MGNLEHGVHKLFENEKDAWEYYKNIKREYVEKILDSYGDEIPIYVKNLCLKRVDDMEYWD